MLGNRKLVVTVLLAMILPSVLLPVTIMADGPEPAPGVVFFSPHNNISASLVIVDNQGTTLFQREVPPNTGNDFKMLPDGRLSYYDPTVDRRFTLLDENYNVVGFVKAGNGYEDETDTHELLLLPNGNFALLIYHSFTYDVTPIEPAGWPTATIVTAILQEVEPDGDVVFEWNAWDHIPLTATNRSLTATTIDYAHANAIELDLDGNYLISNRTLDMVTKIDRQTGDVIWHLGGKLNEFTFTNDGGFLFQHDIRRLPDGNITIFDNRPFGSGYSRAVEYEINEPTRLITKTWEFTGPLASCCGNTQRLANGNTLINWGNVGLVQEVTPEGDVVFEHDFPGSDWSYRAFRFDFQAYRTWLAAIGN